MQAFLRRVPACAEALQGYQQDGNTRMLAALKEQLQRAKEQGRDPLSLWKGPGRS